MGSFKALQGHDMWVLECLKSKQNGYFVDIGAHNGIDHSNTWALEKKYNWKGICVEPNPLYRSYQSLIKNRDCICENVCISDINGLVSFVARGRRPEVSGICYNDEASFHIISAIKKGHAIIELPAITLNDLLKKHNAPKIIDYLSIDVEGHEFHVLKGVNLNEYVFLTLTVEHNCDDRNSRKIDENKRENIKKLLLENNYILDKSVFMEDWYVHKNIKEYI